MQAEGHGYDGLDALLWLVVPVALLCVVPIGFVSGDGLAQSAAYARGTWAWNPNHLLLEPVGSWWQGVTAWLGSARPGPDRLKWLSIMAGGATLGIFRWRIAGPLSESRLKANLATLWVALASAFSRLWISDEAHMLQMPFLAAASAFVVAHANRPGWKPAAFAGVFGGVATLAYISNILVAVVVAALFGLRYALRRDSTRAVQITIGLGLGAVLTALAGLIVAWSAVGPPDVGLVAWIVSYGGGSPGLLAAGYGVGPSLESLAVSGARAAYGGLSSIVDLAPTVEAIRDGSPLSLPVLAPAAFCFAGALVLGLAFRDSFASREQGTSQAAAVAHTLALGIGVAVLAFAVYWNNSDDQFYFQLTIATGALLTGVRLDGRRRAAIVALVLLTVGWNALDMVKNRILYPRTQRAAILERVLAGAELVVYPGYDELDQLFYFVESPEPARRLAITSLANRYPADEGLDVLAERIREALEDGGRVDIVSIYDVPPRQQPWKSLGRAGYGPDAVIRALSAFPVERSSRTAGPFTVRSIASSATTR